MWERIYHRQKKKLFLFFIRIILYVASVALTQNFFKWLELFPFQWHRIEESLSLRKLKFRTRTKVELKILRNFVILLKLRVQSCWAYLLYSNFVQMKTSSHKSLCMTNSIKSSFSVWQDSVIKIRLCFHFFSTFLPFCKP